MTTLDNLIKILKEKINKLFCDHKFKRVGFNKYGHEKEGGDLLFHGCDICKKRKVNLNFYTDQYYANWYTSSIKLWLKNQLEFSQLGENTFQ